MKALAGAKPDSSPPLMAQAVHLPLPAPLIATGPPRRLHREGGDHEQDPVAARTNQPLTVSIFGPMTLVKVVALAIVFCL